MTNLSHVVQDERTARMVLSMIVEPDDAVTGRLLGKLGALELLRLAERDDVVPGLSNVDAQVWRSQFERSDARTLEQNVVEAERLNFAPVVQEAVAPLGQRAGVVADQVDQERLHGHGGDHRENRQPLEPGSFLRPLVDVFAGDVVRFIGHVGCSIARGAAHAA